MKSHYATVSQTELDQQVHKLAMQELEKYRDELFEVMQIDVFDQALAVCLYALEQMGWGKTRLTRFKDQVDDITHMMYTGIMGREMTTRDAQRHFKEKYGIDFAESQYDYGDEEGEANA